MKHRAAKNIHTGKKVAILRIEDVPDGVDPNRRVIVYRRLGERAEDRWEERDFWRHHK